MKGHIQLDPSIWCGRCSYWTWINTYAGKTSKLAAREMGWKYTRAEGWICPDCVKGKAGPRGIWNGTTFQ